MKLNIEQIEIAGFRSFIEPSVLDFAARGPGLHFIRGINELEPRLGSNGAGKSSIFNALCWAFYGQTLGGLRRGDVQPWGQDGKTTVNVRVNGNWISRTNETNGLYIDNKIVGQDDVEDFIGMPLDVLTHTILLGQGQPLFLDLTPKAKLDLFSTVLNLDRWDQREKIASTRAHDLQVEVATIEGQLQSWEGELNQLNQQITNLQTRSQDWQQALLDRLQFAGAEIEKLQGLLTTAKRKRDDADLALDGAGTELKALRPQIEQVTRDYDTVRQNYQDFAIDQKVREQEINHLTMQLQAMSQGKCPTCGQSLKPLHDKHKAELKRKIDRLTKQTGIPSITAQRVTEFAEQLHTLREAEKQFTAVANGAQGALNLYGPMVAEYETKLRALAAVKEEKQEEENPYRAQLADAQRRADELQIALREGKEKVGLLRRRIARAAFWATKGFREVKLYQIEEVLDELEMTSNAMLGEIGLADWAIHYDVERETKSGTLQRGINVSVLSPRNDEPVKWGVWSGGEGQRLRLIGALSLSEVLLNHAGVEPSMEVLDEPTAHLSIEGIDELVAFLADRADRTRRQIFFTDQNAPNSARFASIITVSKTEQGSSIVCG